MCELLDSVPYCTELSYAHISHPEQKHGDKVFGGIVRQSLMSDKT